MLHPYKCYFEITKQAAAWQECIEVVDSQAGRIRAFFEEMQPAEILFTGCTSPYYIGKSAAAYWQSALGIPARAVTCSELLQFPTSFYTTKHGKPVLVVISRSGKTSETLWAVEAFEQQFPGRVFHIGCAPGAPLATKIKNGVLLPKGHEETLAQTSSFSVMFMAAVMIGALLSDQQNILRELRSAPALCESIIQTAEPAVRAIMERKEYRNLFFLGSGPLYGVAKDAALKMIEMSLSEVMCFPFLEVRHGPKSIVDNGSLVVGLFSHGGLGFEANLIEEFTHQYSANTVAITPTAGWQAGNPTDVITVGCDWPDGILGLLYLPVIQLLAYYRAIAKKVNPDESNNLTQFTEIAPVSKAV